MKIVFRFLLIICAFATKANAQTYFNYLYDFDNTNIYSNSASSAYQFANGDYLITGNKYYSSNFGALFFIKLNSNGDTIYSKRYVKYNGSYQTGSSNSLIKCYDGNFVQSGIYVGTIGNADALLVKLDSLGDTLWTHSYGGANFDNANTVCQTVDSGFVLMGVTQSFSNGTASDFYLIKTDKNGVFQWQQAYGTTLAEDCVSGQVTSDGGYIMSGIKNSLLYVLKLDTNANFEWDTQIPNTAGTGFIKQLADNTYLLLGAKSVSGLGYEAYMAKLTSTGSLIWQHTYGGIGDQQFYAVPIILSDGSIVCSGSSTITSHLGMLIKTDSAGNQQWLRTYYANANNANYIYDVKHTSDNGFILIGSGNLTGQDAWVVKVDSNGCEVAGCNVGVEEETTELNNLSIYPNPANGVFTIECTKNKFKSIRIIDVLGRIIIEINALSTNTFNLDISQYSQGIYYISITNENGEIMVKKLIKE